MNISGHNYKSLLKNKDIKVLAENFVSLTLLKAITYIFPLITLPYLAHTIGVDKFGEIAFAASIVIYFQTITDFGFNYTATRDIAQHRENIHTVSTIFSTVMTSKLLLMLGCTVVYAICIYSIPYLHERQALLWLTFLYIPGYVIFPEWFFQAMEKMKYITLMNILVKTISTILVFIVIREKSDYIYQPFLIAIGYIVSGLIALWIIFRKFRIQYLPPSQSEIWSTIKSGWDMFICLLLPNFYSNFSVILLNIYGGSYVTGIYSSGQKFISICDQFSQVLSRTFYPFLARHIDKHKIYVYISGSISIVMSLVLFLGADWIIKLFYTDEFAASAIVIRIMSLGPFFLFLMNTYGPNYLVLQGKEYILRNIIIISSLIGFCLSWVTVIYFSYIGVAVTLVFIWGLRGFLTWHYAKQIIARQIGAIQYNSLK